MSDMLTPDECFALDQTPPAIVEMIRYRLENPAEGGHKHHLLARSLTRLWSKLAGRKITLEQIPVVSLTGPEHYRVHFETAKAYQERGSKGRFAAHGMAANLLSKFAEMSAEEWEKHREMYKTAVRALYANPAYAGRHRSAMQALAQSAEWLENVRTAAQKKTENPIWKAKQGAVMKATTETSTWKTNVKAANIAKAQNTEWLEKHRAAQKKSWADGSVRRSKHKETMRARGKDVIVVFPDGSEKTLSGQADASRALGCPIASISNYLNGKTKTFRGPLKGYSFRYAA